MGDRVFYPGATIGFIGNGVNMINCVMTAIEYGFKTAVVTTDLRLPLESITKYYYSASKIERNQLQALAEQCDFMIYVSDLLDSDTIKWLKQFTYIPQGNESLDIREDRLIERTFLEQLNINLLPYVTVVDLKDIYEAINSLGYPSIVKPIQRGTKHDRQLLISKQSDVAKAALLLETGTYILETYLENCREFEVLVTRDLYHNIRLSPAIQCGYYQRTLQQAFIPAQIEDVIEKEFDSIATSIVDNIDFTGVMRVNFMVSNDTNIYVKSVTPFLNQAGLVFQPSEFDQYQQLIKAAAGVTTSEVDAINPCVLQTFDHSKTNKVKLQWALKDKWQVHFYSHPDSNIAGYINIPTESIDQTKSQIEDTSIWN